MADAVKYEVVNGVAWLTIDRPEVHNAINAAVREGIFRYTDVASHDPDVKAIVLTASGDRVFSAGGDLKEMAADMRQVPGPDFFPTYGVNIAVEKPTIAAVNGLAIAGGFLLAQMCDMCVASENAEFAISEAKVGRGAPWAVPLSSIIPPKVAFEMLVTAQPITAQRAYEIGLINHLVPFADLASRTQEIAEQISANAPLTVAAAKRTVWLLHEEQLREAYQRADDVWAPVYRSEDALEGPRAFAEHRPPVWSGR